jgi:hypothetical protein
MEILHLFCLLSTPPSSPHETLSWWLHSIVHWRKRNNVVRITSSSQHESPGWVHGPQLSSFAVMNCSWSNALFLLTYLCNSFLQWSLWHHQFISQLAHYHINTLQNNTRPFLGPSCTLSYNTVSAPFTAKRVVHLPHLSISFWPD